MHWNLNRFYSSWAPFIPPPPPLKNNNNNNNPGALEAKTASIYRPKFQIYVPLKTYPKLAATKPTAPVPDPSSTTTFDFKSSPLEKSAVSKYLLSTRAASHTTQPTSPISDWWNLKTVPSFFSNSRTNNFVKPMNAAILAKRRWYYEKEIERKECRPFNSGGAVEFETSRKWHRQLKSSTLPGLWQTQRICIFQELWRISLMKLRFWFVPFPLSSSRLSLSLSWLTDFHCH